MTAPGSPRSASERADDEVAAVGPGAEPDLRGTAGIGERGARVRSPSAAKNAPAGARCSTGPRVLGRGGGPARSAGRPCARATMAHAATAAGDPQHPGAREAHRRLRLSRAARRARSGRALRSRRACGHSLQTRARGRGRRPRAGRARTTRARSPRAGLANVMNCPIWPLPKSSRRERAGCAAARAGRGGDRTCASSRRRPRGRRAGRRAPGRASPCRPCGPRAAPIASTRSAMSATPQAA